VSNNALMKYVEDANLPAMSDEAMANALQDAGGEAASGGESGVQYLSFSGKSGTYQLGQNKEEPEGLFIVEPQSIVTGWICWLKSKPIDRVEWSIYQAEKAIAEDELEDHGPYRETHGEGWFQSLGFGCLSLDDGDVQVKFSNNSKSGRNAIRDLMDEIRKRVLAGEPSMPVIEFDAEEFTAQDQKNYKPLLSVEAWVSREAVAAWRDGSLDQDKLLAGETPKKKKRNGSKR